MLAHAGKSLETKVSQALQLATHWGLVDGSANMAGALISFDSALTVTLTVTLTLIPPSPY